MPRAKGSPRRSSLSAKARKALDEVFSATFRINLELEQLSEEELKAITYEMRRTAEGNEHAWLGAAAAAEYRSAVLDQHRTGDGKWFAVVEAFEWDPGEASEDMKIGKRRLLAQTECDSKPAAESEAKRLLAEHASEAGENTEVDAKVLCNLEMTEFYCAD